MPELQGLADRIREHIDRLSKVQRRSILAVFTVACLVVAWQFSKDAYTLENRSKMAITSGTVLAGGHEFEVGQLGPGQRITFRYWPKKVAPLRFQVKFADGSVLADSVDVGAGPLLGDRALSIIDSERRIIVMLGW